MSRDTKNYTQLIQTKSSLKNVKIIVKKMEFAAKNLVEAVNVTLFYDELPHIYKKIPT